jgi:molecular chaperone DnaK (HSP70)
MAILAENIEIGTSRDLVCLFRRGTNLPSEQIQVFTTAQDYQEAVSVTLLATNPSVEGATRTLGQLTLTGIERALRGVPNVEVRIRVTAQGQVSVTACDLGADKSEQAEFGRVNVTE